MALDAYMTKSIAVGSAATFYPTGVSETGGSAVDEFILDTGPIGTLLEFGVVLSTTRTGTSPTLDVTVEESDTTNFAAVATLVTFPQVTGTFPSSTAGGRMRRHATTRRRYVRFKCVAGGTTPDFGTVTVYVAGPQGHRQGLGATYDD